MFIYNQIFYVLCKPVWYIESKILWIVEEKQNRNVFYKYIDIN